MGEIQRLLASHAPLVLRYKFQSPPATRFPHALQLFKRPMDIAMRRLLCFCAFLTLSGSVARAELQLVPEFYEFELDGARVRAVAFADGMRRVVYTPPRGWTYTGSAAELTMRPPGTQRGEASISRYPAQPGQNF